MAKEKLCCLSYNCYLSNTIRTSARASLSHFLTIFLRGDLGAQKPIFSWQLSPSFRINLLQTSGV